jgi:hypothetical protein
LDRDILEQYLAMKMVLKTMKKYESVNFDDSQQYSRDDVLTMNPFHPDYQSTQLRMDSVEFVPKWENQNIM